MSGKRSGKFRSPEFVLERFILREFRHHRERQFMSASAQFSKIVGARTESASQ